MEPLVHQARRFVTFHFVTPKDVELLLLLADIHFNSCKGIKARNLLTLHVCFISLYMFVLKGSRGAQGPPGPQGDPGQMVSNVQNNGGISLPNIPINMNGYVAKLLPL